MNKTLKSIEIDEKNHIYKINGEAMDIHQLHFEINCHKGQWSARETIDVYYDQNCENNQKVKTMNLDKQEKIDLKIKQIMEQ